MGERGFLRVPFWPPYNISKPYHHVIYIMIKATTKTFSYFLLQRRSHSRLTTSARTFNQFSQIPPSIPTSSFLHQHKHPFPYQSPFLHTNPTLQPIHSITQPSNPYNFLHQLLPKTTFTLLYLHHHPKPFKQTRYLNSSISHPPTTLTLSSPSQKTSPKKAHLHKASDG